VFLLSAGGQPRVERRWRRSTVLASHGRVTICDSGGPAAGASHPKPPSPANVHHTAHHNAGRQTGRRPTNRTNPSAQSEPDATAATAKVPNGPDANSPPDIPAGHHCADGGVQSAGRRNTHQPWAARRDDGGGGVATTGFATLRQCSLHVGPAAVATASAAATPTAAATATTTAAATTAATTTTGECNGHGRAGRWRRTGEPEANRDGDNDGNACGSETRAAVEHTPNSDADHTNADRRSHRVHTAAAAQPQFAAIFALQYGAAVDQGKW
jgi:hypothetical protein